MSFKTSDSVRAPTVIDITHDSDTNDFEDIDLKVATKISAKYNKRGKNTDGLNKDGGHDGKNKKIQENIGYIGEQACIIKPQAVGRGIVENTGKLRVRAPPLLMYRMMKTLTEGQKKALRDIGFGCMEKFDISEIPTTLGLKVVESFDHVSCSMNIEGEQLKITRHTIHDVLGVPMGDRTINALTSARMRDKTTSEWRKQFAVNIKRIYPNNVSDRMVNQPDGGRMYQLNFLVLFVTIMAEANKCGTVNQRFLPCITNMNEIKNMDWCGYILDCLKRTKSEWSRGCHYNGPLVFLTLFYAHTLVGSSAQEEDRAIPVINMWSSDDLLNLDAEDCNEINVQVAKVDDAKANGKDASEAGTELNLICQPQPLNSSKRRCVDDGIRSTKKTYPTKCEVINSEIFEDNEENKDPSNPYCKQKLLEDMITPTVQVGIEILNFGHGGAVSYGRVHLSISAKEYMNVVKNNLSMLSDIISETHNTIDQAIRDYPDDNEFIKLKEEMHSKFSKAGMERDQRGTHGPETVFEKETNGCNDLGDSLMFNDTQFFNSPTVMKEIESLELAAYESTSTKTTTRVDVTSKSRRLSYESPTFDLGISQAMCKETTDVGRKNTPAKDESLVPRDSTGYVLETRFTNVNVQTKDDEVTEISVKRRHLETPEGRFATHQIMYVINGVIEGENTNPLVSGTKSATVAVSRKQVVNECEGVDHMGYHAVPLSSIKPEIKIKYNKRETKLPHVMLSPYIRREVCVYGNVSVAEKRLSDCIFSARFPAEDIIFQTQSVECQRVIFESMMPDVTVVGGAIDVWCHVLNYEERLRNPDKVSRLFCNTSMVNEGMMDFDVSGRMFKIFAGNMNNVLKQSVYKCIGDVDLVFFPILQGNHYYVMCYNLMTPNLHIIDNIESQDVDLLTRYEKLPFVLTSLFAEYLKSVQHPRAYKVKNPFIKILKMTWQTRINFVDCGVFVMRHMEIYKGDASSGGFITGFVKEGKDQKKQLAELRVKYLTKMLLCEMNMKKSKMIDECENYQNLARFEKMKLKSDAAVRIEGRISRMIRPVK